MTELGIETDIKRCKKCSWCAKYTNWSEVGAPKLPDTHYCTHSKVTEVRPDCKEFNEPYKDDEED